MRNSLKTIVVVEDEALIRMFAASELADAGYEVIEADGPAAALKALATDEVFLLFTDVNMPGDMDGLALARMVHRRWPHTHVLVASADDRVTCATCRDFDGFFRKPYRVADVVAYVETLGAH
jgi:CheY-like chemotaxis protein